MTKKKKWETYIRVSQLTDNMEEAIPIAEYSLMDKWERLERIFGREVRSPEFMKPLQVWIEMIDEEGSWPEDEKRIAISPAKARWFLESFLKEPKSIWSKVKQKAER